MTCASCVARVEKKLNRLEGVEASVNLATASARVRFDPALVDETTLVETVEATGYSAALPSGDEADPVAEEAAYAAGLFRRLLLAVPLTVAVLVLSMVPGVPRLPWVQLVLTVPVVLYAGWPFHRAAAINARHLASTMDTLVSLGTLVALAWSVVQLAARGDAPLLRGGRDRHHLPAARSLPRGAGEVPRRIGAARTARARREASRGARRGPASARSTSPTCDRGCGCWCARARRSPRTVS